MKIYYCWRCKNKLPFLNEKEWADLQSVYKTAFGSIMDKYDDAIWKDRLKRQKLAENRVEELAGMGGVAFAAIDHHRLQGWGSECSDCGELLRTPKSSFCANCGKRSNF